MPNKLNKGAMFVVAFRWMLLLLATLIVEKCLEGVVVCITTPGPLPAVGGDHGDTFLVHPVRAFPRIATGAVVTVSIVLLIARYFLCAIEPLVLYCQMKEKKKLRDPIDFKPGWEVALVDAPLVGIAMVLVVAGVEFCCFFVAAEAIPHPDAFLWCIPFVVGFDMVVFFVLPILVRYGVGVGLRAACVVVRVVVFIVRIVLWPLVLGVCVVVKVLPPKSFQPDLNKIYAIVDGFVLGAVKRVQDWGKAVSESMRLYVSGWFEKYFVWNVVAIGCIPVAFWVTWLVDCGSRGMVISSLVVVVSIVNLCCNRAIYRNNIGVLMLARV